jgi:HMG (high mobility group) box
LKHPSLSRTISQRWRKLSPEGKKFYSELSAKDWQRFQNDIAQNSQVKDLVDKSAITATLTLPIRTIPIHAMNTTDDENSTTSSEK